MIKRGSHSLMCFAFSYDRLYWWQVVSQAEIPFWHKEKSGRSKEVGSHSPIQAVIALFAALFFEVILFSLLTGRHFTTNISTRGILWHLESTEIHFQPGFHLRLRWGTSWCSPRPISRLRRRKCPPHSPLLSTPLALLLGFVGIKLPPFRFHYNLPSQIALPKAAYE